MSEDNSYSRIDWSYCYVCSSPRPTLRTPGDFNRERRRCQEEAKQGFYRTTFIDIHPVLCNREACERRYAELPRTTYVDRVVPYIADVTFDGADFAEFPLRNNRPEIDGSGLDLSINSAYSGKDAYKLEPLFQAWLFFGLLHETLEVQFVQRAYIEAISSNQKILVLTHLDAAIENWMSRLQPDLDEGLLNEKFSRLKTALETVDKMLDATRYFDSSSEEFESFSEDLREFIASAGEVICWAFSSIFPTSSVAATFSRFSATPRTLHLVTDLGWCKHEAKESTAAISTLAVKALHSGTDRKTSQSYSHEQCTEEKCTAFERIYENSHGTTHRHNCARNGCRPIRIEEDQMLEVCSILESHSFPLIKLDRGPTGALTHSIVAYQKGIRYVAISHTWAQGMGNKQDNSLSLCHTEYLYHLIKDLLLLQGIATDSILLWLDTFCLPLKSRAAERYQRMGLDLMRTSYEAASDVLVVDSELSELDHLTKSVLEVATKVSVATWTRRMWPLQECQLPKEIWFQFKKRAVNAHALHLALRDVARGPMMRDRIAATELLAMFMNLRIFSGRYNSEIQDDRAVAGQELGQQYDQQLGQEGSQARNQEREIAMMAMAMSKRAVDREKDEALCIASLIDLEVEPITRHESHVERMKAVWLQMSDKDMIPRVIAFQWGRKLNERGFCWAFSTFRQNSAPLGFHQESRIKGEAHPEGLLIDGTGFTFEIIPKLPGFEIKDLGVKDEQPFLIFIIKFAEDDWQIFQPLDDYFEQFFPSGISSRPPLRDVLRDPGKRLALLKKHISSDPTSKDDGMHLLVEVTDRKGDAMLCKRMFLGKLYRPEPPAYAAAIALACHQASILKQRPDFQALRRFPDPNTTDPDTLAARKAAHLALEPQLDFDQTLCNGNAALQRLIPIASGQPVPLMIGHALAKGYTVATEHFPESQKWYVD